MNANFARLDSKTIAKICRTLIALTLLAYLVDIILISSPSFSSWNFKNNTILTDFNIFIIVFVSFFFVFAMLYECFYNLKEKIKTKILRYIYMVLAGLLSCLVIFFCILITSDISRFVEIEVAMVFGIIISPIFLLMFTFMFIDKILCKARGQ
ncbi:hypothetical protein [Helicobacter sp. UBA3407]|uniref:hypothetical protein n=1 Tax=Helicobacter TaxID=209 RepID=UPI00261DDEFF|nr:hypothetical protein [Helicobacter sp. UBA3407]